MGWKRAYEGMEQPVKAKPAKAEVEPEQVVLLPPAVAGDQAINRKAETVKTATKPPKRYTEGTLLAAMESIDKEIDDPRLKKVMQNKEKAGIGTDATRSSVIEGLFKRGYIANDKKFIVPTERGMHSIAQIEAVAGELVDPVLTAIWEDKLSQIEAGSLQLAQFELELADWLQVLVAKMRTQAKPRPARISAPGMPQTAAGPVKNGPVYPCPSCSKPMRPRSAQGSTFWGCSGYPACRCTLPDVGGKPGQRQSPAQAMSAPSAARSTAPAGGASAAASTPAQRACDACGKAMVLRRGLNGPFYGCSGFPVCRNTAVVGISAA
jgi:DNA topoisomerase-3